MEVLLYVLRMEKRCTLEFCVNTLAVAPKIPLSEVLDLE